MRQRRWVRVSGGAIVGGSLVVCMSLLHGFSFSLFLGINRTCQDFTNRKCDICTFGKREQSAVLYRSDMSFWPLPYFPCAKAKQTYRMALCKIVMDGPLKCSKNGFCHGKRLSRSCSNLMDQFDLTQHLCFFHHASLGLISCKPATIRHASASVHKPSLTWGCTASTVRCSSSACIVRLAISLMRFK